MLQSNSKPQSHVTHHLMQRVTSQLSRQVFDVRHCSKRSSRDLHLSVIKHLSEHLHDVTTAESDVIVNWLTPVTGAGHVVLFPFLENITKSLLLFTKIILLDYKTLYWGPSYEFYLWCPPPRARLSWLIMCPLFLANHEWTVPNLFPSSFRSIFTLRNISK